MCCIRNINRERRSIDSVLHAVHKFCCLCLRRFWSLLSASWAAPPIRIGQRPWVSTEAFHSRFTVVVEWLFVAKLLFFSLSRSGSLVDFLLFSFSPFYLDSLWAMGSFLGALGWKSSAYRTRERLDRVLMAVRRTAFMVPRVSMGNCPFSTSNEMTRRYRWVLKTSR